ncbi:hypothetical protein HO173_009099 [Letharia columbiana]|uniref:Uncharacterized protein n=1 Tax=Letharia columbiana TaxID=112416 RepID=A0A8H6FQ75_9LECA|nr:uncharacterized protein HO173_009099 [Letharia columbiana]KAF6232660.1 hypothetical protein HO173_009099 [Letharia columbiana]
MIQTNALCQPDSPPSHQAAQEQSTTSAKLAADGCFTESTASNNEGDINTTDNPNHPPPTGSPPSNQDAQEQNNDKRAVRRRYRPPRLRSAPAAGAGSWNPSTTAGNQLAITADDPKRTFAERHSTSGSGRAGAAQRAAGGSAPLFGTSGRRGGRRLRKHCGQRIMKSDLSSGSMPAGSDIFR